MGQPGYAPYAGYPGYPGYGYYPWPPAPPKRDTYLLVVAIIAFVCSCLLVLGGLGSVLFMVLLSVERSSGLLPMSDSLYFAEMVQFLSFALAGLAGGGFCFYHSLRSLFLKKPSKNLWLPGFWVFLFCYLGTLALGLWLHTQNLDTVSPPALGMLVYLAGIFPALTILTLGVRRLSFAKFGSARVSASPGHGARSSKVSSWPTSWRRFTLALVSGATLSIGLAGLLELVFLLIMVGAQSGGLLQLLNNFDTNSSQFGILLILAAVVAPIVEELVKPLAVVILIGRVRSKAEAFTLGLACGIGFNLIETAGYISQGYTDWLNVALGRSGVGLLHGFGAAMMALGWYILTHPQEGRTRKRVLLALGCGLYAIFQHALWNSTAALLLLPGAVGNFFQTWSWNVGPFTIDGPELVNFVELILILVFFIYMTGRLRARPVAALPREERAQHAESIAVTPV